MSKEDTLERIARAIYEGPPPDDREETQPRFQRHPWGRLTPALRAMWLEHGQYVYDEVIAALAAAGMAVVPVEPTEAMLDASWGTGEGRLAERAWRAMIAAAVKS